MTWALAASIRSGQRAAAAASSAAAKQRSETPKCVARIHALTGTSTAQAPSPACRNSVPTRMIEITQADVRLQ